MNKDKIAVVVRKYDNTRYDIEVFNWNNETNQKNKLLSYLSSYSLKNINVVNSYLERLEREYDVVEIEKENEKKEIELSIEDMLKPQLATYVFYEDELQPFLETLFFKKNGFKLELDIIFDSEYVYFKVSENNSAEIMRKVKDIYGYDFSKSVLENILDNPDASYSVLEDSGIVHIHIPYEEVRETIASLTI